MIKLARIGIASAVLAATSLTAVTPAAARDNGGVAVVAGIIGLGLGAAIASDRPHYRQTQYYHDQAPQTYYYPPQSYGNGYGYGYGYGRGYRNDYAYGSGYGNGYGSRWEQRRAQEARQRQWERERYAHRRDRDDDDYRGYDDRGGYGD